MRRFRFKWTTNKLAINAKKMPRKYYNPATQAARSGNAKLINRLQLQTKLQRKLLYVYIYVHLILGLVAATAYIYALQTTRAHCWLSSKTNKRESLTRRRRRTDRESTLMRERGAFSIQPRVSYILMRFMIMCSPKYPFTLTHTNSTQRICIL